MKYHVGIDLGTSNSAICSFDGEDVTIYKSPEQHSVTPSAIYFDKRRKYYGSRAYQMAANSPEHVAVKFKKLIGSSTKVDVPALGLSLSPEECSAEILQLLYGYLPEEMRIDQESGTVITVPAAFNTMQKDATLSAAERAGIGKVALMQEPVAAVMTAMRSRKSDGMFLIYDLGGGTFDIALAESIGGRVSLLSHGGIPMCGGSDFDRSIVDSIVKPWLREQFRLPDDLSANPAYRRLLRLASWAAEAAKIELSGRDETLISLPETELRTKDDSGSEMFFEIPLSRKDYDPLIGPRIRETIEATRQVLNEAGLSSNEIERVVFVGGPTQYESLRKMVCFELGIAGDTKVDPMTAVAEGAAIFAESIDWTTGTRGRKSAKGSIATGGSLALSFEFTARTPELRARLVVRCDGGVAAGAQFQVDSMDTGWSSGRMDLADGTTIALTLSKNGDNRFKVFVFDPAGAPLTLADDVVTITRTTATIDAIPASHSLGIQVKERLGSDKYVLDYLVRKGDHLPAKGQRKYKAETSLRPGGAGEIVLQLWEGEIGDPVSDNDAVGSLRITGEDFEEGVIQPGDQLLCDYEVSDSGKIFISVSVPSIGSHFKRDDFYVRQTSELDFATEGPRIAMEGASAMGRVDALAEKIDDSRFDTIRAKLEDAEKRTSDSTEPEDIKRAHEDVLEAKRLLAQVRKDRFAEVREIELAGAMEFVERVRPIAKPNEAAALDNAVRAARRDIQQRDSKFEQSVQSVWSLVRQILYRQDWFMVDIFRWLENSPHLFYDKPMRDQLLTAGRAAIKADDMDRLREVVAALQGIRVPTRPEEEFAISEVNILRG